MYINIEAYLWSHSVIESLVVRKNRAVLDSGVVFCLSLLCHIDKITKKKTFLKTSEEKRTTSSATKKRYIFKDIRVNLCPVTSQASQTIARPLSEVLTHDSSRGRNCVLSYGVVICTLVSKGMQQN